MVGASFPDFVDPLVEFGSGLGVDNKSGFAITEFENFLNIMGGNVAAVHAGDGDDAEVFTGVAVISGKEFCLGFLKFWFESGFLLLFCHKNSIPSLEKMCYNMLYHIDSARHVMIF